MNKRKIFLITGLFFLILIGLRIGWISLFTAPDHPKVVQGIVDLRDWDFSSHPAVTLDGEWEFYPNKLIMTEDTDTLTSNSDREWIHVPGNWMTSSYFQVKKNAYGSGSYRLRILVDPAKKADLGIRVLGTYSSSELFINGQILGNNGQPSKEKELYSGRVTPYSVSFTADSEMIELVLHVSNYDYMDKGGIFGAVKLGSKSAINFEQRLSINMQILVAVVLVIHIVYAFLLFFIGYRNKILVFFIMAFLSAVVMILIDDDRLLLDWIPLNLTWTKNIAYISYTGVSLFLILYIYHLFPEDRPVKITRWVILVYVLFALFTIMVPSEFSYLVAPAFTMIYFPAFPVLWIIMLRTVLKNNEEAIFLLLGVTSVTSNIIWGYLKNWEAVGAVFYPIDLIIAFLAFASFWFKRFFRTSEETARLAHKLQQADKQKDDFLANTSHELRTPLHGMMNIAQTILEDEKQSSNPRHIKNLELLLSVGHRMSHVINDLLDLTQLKENRIRLQPSSIHVQSAASGVLDMLKFMTEGKPIQLLMNIPGSFPPVMADEKRLVQVLFNLVHNAIKYTNEGQIKIHAEVRNGVAYIHVSDTGIGMDPELQAKALLAYEQGPVGITTAVGGIGLGLSICNQIIQLHGGKLMIESAPGQGSVFTFTLPLSEYADLKEKPWKNWISADYVATTNDEKPLQPSNGKSRTGAEKPKILVVDDDPVNLKILDDILSGENNITKATNGKEALAQLDLMKWDLIITDVMMPKMSGYELTRLIRERFSISELPILLLTARGLTEDVHSGFIAGANDYVTKPVDALELKSRVRALTDLKQSIHERLQMEAAYLQAQIRPHFLFNTLNSITALSEIDTAKMNDLIDAFSSYLRISFASWNSDQLVTIEHELELVRTYLYIEKERFDERLNIVWDVDESAKVMLPPLTIQPIVENAVKHGVLSRSKGGTIYIRIADLEDRVEISISDDGIGIEEEKVSQLLNVYASEKHGIGLMNTDRRLKQFYRKGLTIKSKLDKGTTVSFEIPKE